MLHAWLRGIRIYFSRTKINFKLAFTLSFSLSLSLSVPSEINSMTHWKNYFRGSTYRTKIRSYHFSGCHLFGCFGTLSGLSQIWTICLISAERANAIFHPLPKEKRLTHNQVRFSLNFSLAAIVTSCWQDGFCIIWDPQSYRSRTLCIRCIHSGYILQRDISISNQGPTLVKYIYRLL